jgi:hypothetical protein
VKIKWIVGYIDGYDAIHYKVVKIGDTVDSHNQIWPGRTKQTKWRWMPDKPYHLNTYGIDLCPEDEDKVWNLITKLQ